MILYFFLQFHLVLRMQQLPLEEQEFAARELSRGVRGWQWILKVDSGFGMSKTFYPIKSSNWEFELARKWQVAINGWRWQNLNYLRSRWFRETHVALPGSPQRGSGGKGRFLSGALSSEGWFVLCMGHLLFRLGITPCRNPVSASFCEWLLPGESTMLKLNLCHCGPPHPMWSREVKKSEAQGCFFNLRKLYMGRCDSYR